MNGASPTGMSLDNARGNVIHATQRNIVGCGGLTMERRLIDANALAKWLDKEHHVDKPTGKCDERQNRVLGIAVSALKNSQIAPTIDAVEVVRCRECAYFREKHVLTPDGQRKSYSEFPPEAFGSFGDTSVTCSYGINVGSQCLVDCDEGYGEDKTVFRRPDDYCSRGVRREPDVKT